MTSLTVDVGSGVSDDRVVSYQNDGDVGGEPREQVSGQGARQPDHRPPGLGGGAAVAGDVAGGERTDGPEEVGDVASSGGEDRRPEEDQEASVGRLGEGRGEGDEQGQGFVG